MTGQHDLIKALRILITRFDQHVISMAMHAVNGRMQVHVLAKGRD